MTIVSNSSVNTFSMRFASGKKNRLPPRTLLIAVASSAPNCTPTPTVVIPTPDFEASRAMFMKLFASVRPTLGRSSVNSITRVLPANLWLFARLKPTDSPSSMLVAPALWMRSICRAIAFGCFTGVGCIYTCERSP